MPQFVDPNPTKNFGIVGRNMRGRTDRPEYRSGALQIENYLCLPHGGIERRRGNEFVLDLSSGLTVAQFPKAYLRRFDFNRDQQYVLAFLPGGNLKILRNKLVVATISHPYQDDHLRSLKRAQQGDTMYIVHERYPPRQLKRDGRDRNWLFQAITFTTMPFYKYRYLDLTPSNTTGSITLTIAGSVAYWKAGHSLRIKVKLNNGQATTTSPFQDATGGTAGSSAGTAGNAWDNNNGTICSAGVNGWIGYQFAGATTVRVVGIRRNNSTTLNLSLERDSAIAFGSPTLIATITLPVTAGNWVYFDVPNYTGEAAFRIRETGGANLDVQDMVFNKGLVINATVNTTLANTNARKTWTEQIWGENHGYPIACTFFGDRFILAGIRDEPSLIVGSKVGDYINFDDTTTNDDGEIEFLALSQKNHRIMNVIPSRAGLAVFTSEGEFIAEAEQALITPTKPPRAYVQSEWGSADINLETVDGEVMYFRADLSRLLRFDYQFDRDQFESDSKTVYAHELFTDAQRPRRMALLKKYRDTQGQYLFVPRSGDGALCVLTYDKKKDVQAWTIQTTGLSGKFLDVVQVETLHNPSVGTIPTIYFLVHRVVNGVDKLFLERLASDENSWSDHWYFGRFGSPTAGPFQIPTLPNTEIVIVADGTVEGYTTTDGSGNFTISRPVSELFAGIPYQRFMETLPIRAMLQNVNLAGKKIQLKEIIIEFKEAFDHIVNDVPVRFRRFDEETFNRPLFAFTGLRRVKIKNRPGQKLDPTILMGTLEPLGQTINSYNVVGKVGVNR